jgi:phosphohistidine phosphatase
MKLLLVRHAIAFERDTPGISDALRPLTEDGIARFKKSARALSQLVTADVVLTSPLLRAKQTAEILARQWSAVAVHEAEPLGSGSRAHFEEVIGRLSNASIIAAVGHEPTLSEWTAEWLGAASGLAFPFKKGGAALIEFDEGVAPGAGRLVYFLPPKVVKTLAT